MSIWDDQDALYRPKLREGTGADQIWGIWDKAAKEFADGREFDKQQAERVAMRMNDNNAAAESATW